MHFGKVCATPVTWRAKAFQSSIVGRTATMIEHNVRFVRDLCTRAAFMFAGRIIASGSVDSLLADKRLTALYFGG
jgi:ABC-type branched-subunit amino acid transport system ATPase component